MTITTVLIFLLILLLLLILARYGAARWQRENTALQATLRANQRPVANLQPAEPLPPPVQRYLHAVLPAHPKTIIGVTMEHTGTFNTSETEEQWKPFTSTQRVVMERPGFIWNAKIKMMPGLSVYVHDAYVAGEGVLHAAVAGLVTVAAERGTAAIAAGELMRFLAEMPWYPTKALGVQWQPVDDNSAQATLTDGESSVSLQFQFDEAGLISGVRAEARPRTLNGQLVPMPWAGRFWDYQEREGLRIPMQGEISWVTPQGPRPYWRGQITAIRYQFADSA